jgi:XTP/dITP diphosphohydrolase
MEKLLLATGNQGKIREYRLLLDGIPYNIVSPAEEAVDAGVEETGGSYAENAWLKAVALSRSSGLMALADDSGLEVDALGGTPGLFSARYAGTAASDRDRVARLLSELEGIPWEKRTARFRCVIAVVQTDGSVEFFEGECLGFITLAVSGKHGFGYDPVFYLPEAAKTMAELPISVKNRLSHRARAAARARDWLFRLHKKKQGEREA